MCIVGLTIFLGGSIIYKEIERLTILTLLSRPISRTQFLMGKYVGFMALLMTFIFGFYIVFSINLLLLGFDFNFIDLAIAFLGIILECFTLLAVTTFFSTFCASFLTILFSVGFFLVAHWSVSIATLEQHGQKTLFYYIVHFAKQALPNFEHFNWRLNALESFVTGEQIVRSSGIAVLWILIFLICASFIFRNKDFA